MQLRLKKEQEKKRKMEVEIGRWGCSRHGHTNLMTGNVAYG